MRAVRAIAGIGLVLLLGGCGAVQQATAEAPVVAKPVCSPTAATPASARPKVLAGSTGSWYGSADLWVGLPDHPATVNGNMIELKFPWVTLDQDTPSQALGAPEVSAARTNPSTPVAATFSGYARAFGTGNLAFWPATIDFPAPGCWTVTGRMKSTTVQFVIEVKSP